MEHDISLTFLNASNGQCQTEKRKKYDEKVKIRKLRLSEGHVWYPIHQTRGLCSPES